MARTLKGKRFRTLHADSNALWEVKKSRGAGVFTCEIVNEPFEHDGKMYDSDWVGTVKVFAREEIERAIAFEKWQRELHDEHKRYYESLELGQIVHYHHSFGQFIRCEVVIATKIVEKLDHPSIERGDKCLQAQALVGDWRSHDLHRNSYHVRGVRRGRKLKPNAGHIYENPKATSTHQHPDPTELEPLELGET